MFLSLFFSSEKKRERKRPLLHLPKRAVLRYYGGLPVKQPPSVAFGGVYGEGSVFIQILIDEIDLPIIVDAGIGRPSQACEAMEMGAAAIMANTALATAGDLPLMASAFKKAIEAGRQAYLAGLGRVLTRGASASDPLTGFLRN